MEEFTDVKTKSMLPIIYLYGCNGVPASEDWYCLWQGLQDRGYKVRFFEGDADLLPRNSMVLGKIEDVKAFFNRYNFKVRKPLGIPESLRSMVDRKVWILSGKEFKDAYLNRNSPRPIFAKPNDELKTWPSGVLKGHDSDELLRAEIKDDSEVLVSEYVDFISEYRVFIDHGKMFDCIVGMKNYRGSFSAFPDMEYIKACVAKYTVEDHPVAYTMDFGVLSDGKTQLIELNDAWSIGSYGLDSETYTNLILRRWIEIMRKENGIVDYAYDWSRNIALRLPG